MSCGDCTHRVELIYDTMASKTEVLIEGLETSGFCKEVYPEDPVSCFETVKVVINTALPIFAVHVREWDLWFCTVIAQCAEYSCVDWK